MLERELLKVGTEHDLTKYLAYMWFKELRLIFCDFLDPSLSRSRVRQAQQQSHCLSKHSKTTPTYDSGIKRHSACGQPLLRPAHTLTGS